MRLGGLAARGSSPAAFPPLFPFPTSTSFSSPSLADSNSETQFNDSPCCRHKTRPNPGLDKTRQDQAERRGNASSPASQLRQGRTPPSFPKEDSQMGICILPHRPRSDKTKEEKKRKETGPEKKESGGTFRPGQGGNHERSCRDSNQIPARHPDNFFLSRPTTQLCVWYNPFSTSVAKNPIRYSRHRPNRSFGWLPRCFLQLQPN